MDFIVNRFIKMLIEDYKLKCEYTRDRNRYIVFIRRLDNETKRFFLNITCNVVTGCTVERDKNGDVVKQNIHRADKKFIDDFGPGSIRIIFTDDNYGMRVNTLDARLREFFTSDHRMDIFYKKASSL